MASVICGTTGTDPNSQSGVSVFFIFSNYGISIRTYFTLNGLAQVVSPPLLVDDRLIDLARGQVVVSRKPNVEETLVVSQIKVHLASIVQYKNLSCRAFALCD